MEKRLQDVLEQKWGNYILPFYWQHGESRELLEEGMEKIHDSGIGAVCVESRPHPDFLGERWWQDMDIIMSKAKELDMKVWVLDDAHFPSGYCNGRIGEDSPYGKKYLTHYTVDIIGPAKGNAFMVKVEADEQLVGVTLSKRHRQESFYQTEISDVTPLVADGKVYLDIPEGVWAVTVMKMTKRGSGRKGYINPIDRAAVRFFIDTVYEAHYLRYGADFGKTFAGFFSDEPEIGNCVGEYVHDSYIGQPTMTLPWSGELEAGLRALWGRNFVSNLLAMWVNVDEYETEAECEGTNHTGFSDNRPEWAHVPKGWTERTYLEQKKRSNRTGLLRREFMELVSKLYGENFTTQIGDWCRGHGVEYIGHVIEDGGTHSHLGLGTGHFFKALWGQDMSGIDVVLQQIRPQMDDFAFYSVGGRGFYHGELFHYGLAKMGTSLGHLDPKKQGRTMCEVFGAYGWTEGLKLMKWIMDHMLVRGVNYFVPHAFTMKDFPDPDCPPHFYARGRNPQFPYFKNLMEYTNRVSHLIIGGVHVPSVALLYTAEQEWMGPVRKFEKDARELTRGQIDFEVVPEEILLEAPVKGGKLLLGEETVSALVVPGSFCISGNLAEKCACLTAQGVEVVFTESLEYILSEDGCLEKTQYVIEAACEDKGEKIQITDHSGNVLGCLVKAENLVSALREKGCAEILPSGYQPWLRYYHYKQLEGEFYLFFGEAVTEGCDTCLTFTDPAEELWWYDPWLNRLAPCESEQDGSIHLALAPYEMKILYVGSISGEMQRFIEPKTVNRQNQIVDLSNVTWDMTLSASGDCNIVKYQDKAGDISGPGKYPNFSGQIGYRTVFSMPEHLEDENGATLDLGEVYETAHVRVNGREAGVRIAPPYIFDISDMLLPGENTLDVLVTNTLVHELRDYFSMSLPMEPSGLLGPVQIRY